MRALLNKGIYGLRDDLRSGVLQDVLIASLFGTLHTGDYVVLYNGFFASRPEDRP